MRWGRKEARAPKDTQLEESHFLNTFLKKDALREERGPRPKRHSEGGKRFLNTRLKKDALREESDFLNTLLKKMRWGRKEANAQKHTLREENIF